MNVMFIIRIIIKLTFTTEIVYFYSFKRSK